jgi:hypothetical protein
VKLADGSVEINLGKFKGCKGLFVKSLRVQGLLVERDKREGVLRVKSNRGRGSGQNCLLHEKQRRGRIGAAGR